MLVASQQKGVEKTYYQQFLHQWFLGYKNWCDFQVPLVAWILVCFTVPSGWHNDKWTGVSGCHKTSSISHLACFACKAWNKILPKRYLVIVIVTSFLYDALETLNVPAWVAIFLIFCLLMDQENLSESLAQSSINWSCTFLTVFIRSSKRVAVFFWVALPVTILKR